KSLRGIVAICLAAVSWKATGVSPRRTVRSRWKLVKIRHDGISQDPDHLSKQLRGPGIGGWGSGQVPLHLGLMLPAAPSRMFVRVARRGAYMALRVAPSATWGRRCGDSPLSPSPSPQDELLSCEVRWLRAARWVLLPQSHQHEDQIGWVVHCPDQGSILET